MSGGGNSNAPPFEQVGRGFSAQFYNCMAGQRDQVAGVYREATLVTWCNEQLMGINQIMTKITGLGFRNSQWKAEEVDCQPLNNGGGNAQPGVIVVIQGQCRIEGEDHPLRFNDVQILQQDQQGWYIANQVFRILGGGE